MLILAELCEQLLQDPLIQTLYRIYLTN